MGFKINNYNVTRQITVTKRGNNYNIRRQITAKKRDHNDNVKRLEELCAPVSASSSSDFDVQDYRTSFPLG